jgi:hypothetical protein
MAVVDHEDKLYVHPMQDPTSTRTAEFKKACKEAASKAREERNTLMLEARKMLTNFGQLRVKTATPGSCLSIKDLESQKAELLERLDKAAYVLSWSVRNARSKKNANALRNYKRKRGQIKKIRAQLSNTATQTEMSLPEEGSQYPDPVAEHYNLSPNPLMTRPHQLKEFVRQTLMNEFWTRIARRPMNFPGCRS